MSDAAILCVDDEAAIDRAKKDANLYACIYKPWTEEEWHPVIRSALS